MSDEKKKKLQMDDEKRSFIREQIAPERHSSIKKFAGSIGRTSILAIVFGLVGGLVFSAANSYFSNYFHENPKMLVSISTAEKSPEPSVEPSMLPSKSPEPSNEPSAEPESSKSPEKTDFIESYVQLCRSMTEVGEAFNQSVVIVEGIQSGVDWFDNPAEASNQTSGIIVADDKERYLILVSLDEIEQAEKINVTFCGGNKSEAEIISRDSELNLAVIAADHKEFTEKQLEETGPAQFGDSYYAQVGTPVLALGSPDGSVYSMILGRITGKQMGQDITDGELELFSTDMSQNASGEGVIVDTKGRILGLISHQFDKSLKNEFCTAISINRVKSIIEKMINGEKRAYLGITASNIPDEYKEKLKVDHGIYVTDVKANSPALDGGIQMGDIIIEINGLPVSSVSMYMNQLAELSVREEVRIKVMRTSKEGNPLLTEVFQTGSH